MSVSDELRAIYAEIPRIDCKGLCHDACGPIGMQPLELRRLRKARPDPPNRGGLHCPYLTQSGRCSAYRARPLICRLWGVIESLPCHYGCKPERVISGSEAMDLFRRIDELSPGDAEYLGDIGIIRLAREAGLLPSIESVAARFLPTDATTGRAAAPRGDSR